MERRAYSVGFPGSYLAYRLNVTEDNDDNDAAPIVVISIGKLEFLRCLL